MIQAVLMVGLHEKIADISSFLQCGREFFKALASLLWVAECKLWLQEFFLVRSIESQGSLHKCLISRNNTVLQFDMNALHDEEKFKYWAQRTLHRHVY